MNPLFLPSFAREIRRELEAIHIDGPLDGDEHLSMILRLKCRRKDLSDTYDCELTRRERQLVWRLIWPEAPRPVVPEFWRPRPRRFWRRLAFFAGLALVVYLFAAITGHAQALQHAVDTDPEFRKEYVRHG